MCAKTFFGWHRINPEHPGLSQTAFPINSSSSSPGERHSPLSSRSPPEFILDLSEMAEGWRMTAGRKGVGIWEWEVLCRRVEEWRRCGGGGCLITNKTPAAHRPAAAPAIRAVT